MSARRLQDGRVELVLSLGEHAYLKTALETLARRAYASARRAAEKSLRK